MRHRILWLAALAAPQIILAACAGREAPPPCPAVVVVPGAERLTRFEGAGRDLTDVLFEAELQDVSLTCDYEPDAIEAVLSLRLVTTRGPADLSGRAAVSYFVAIGTREREILAREAFTVEVPFAGNRRRMAAVEEVTPRIPLPPGRSGASYIVYLGLELRPDELRYNRESR